jgi:hypothetical protein
LDGPKSLNRQRQDLEFRQPSTYHKLQKTPGIPGRWNPEVLDVGAKVVRIHRLNQAKTYSEETHCKDTITLQAFPDVTIELGNLF